MEGRDRFGGGGSLRSDICMQWAFDQSECKRPFTAFLLALAALLISHKTVLAHEHITVGDYEIVIGWAVEPPIAGQRNAIFVNVLDTSTGEEQPVEDISSLTVTVSYGGQSRQLALARRGEDSPGEFESPILPTIPGQYTILLGGQLGDTPVDVSVEPEEVAPSDTIQFPSLESEQPNADLATIHWLIYFSVMIGFIALVLAVMALRKAG